VRSALVFAAALHLSACNNDRQSVGGVDGEYCVPPQYLSSDYWWIEENPEIDSQGFSFLGCELAGIRTSEFCDVPRSVVSVDVEPKFLNDHVKWRVLRKSVALSDLSPPTTVVFEETKEGRMIVVTTSRPDPVWYVFSQAEDRKDQGPVLADEDSLLINCTRETGISKLKYICTRYHRNPHYSVRYRFNTDEEIPILELRRLDAELDRTVDSWKCEK
jgi:hypothetical protein